MICEETPFVNSTERCMVCLKPFTDTLLNPMIKHHIRYYPEAIAWVHHNCHKQIHDAVNPLDVYIQYELEEQERFISEKKVLG
jgi:hypothetical protein